MLLAIALQRTEKFDDAVPLMQRVVEVAKSLYGLEHPSYAYQLENQGYLDYARRDVAASVERFRKAYEIQARTQGEKHSKTQEVGGTLANVLERRSEQLEAAEDFAAALPLREEALAMRTAQEGADHWQSVDARWALEHDKELAKLTPEQRKDLAEADAALSEAAKLTREKKPNAAIGATERSVRIRKEILGDKHRLYSVSRHRQGMATYNRGDVKQALEILLPNLELVKQTFSPTHPTYAIALDAVADVYQSQGDTAHALPLRRKCTRSTRSRGARNTKIRSPLAVLCSARWKRSQPNRIRRRI